MAFCKFSSEKIIGNQTTVDNVFINEFLPYAPSECTKVYLYGLYLCQAGDSYDNNIEHFSRILNLSKQEVEDSFLYWQEQGLVKVLNTIPLEIRYLPLKNIISGAKKWNKEKYSVFNAQAQEIIEGRQITPNEYSEYYTLIEAFHIQPEALLMIMKYCTNIKGGNVGYPYILTVAKNWATEGVKTTETVEEKLNLYESIGTEVTEVLKLVGSKRTPSIEERELYSKWKEQFGFAPETILAVGKGLKKKLSKLSFDRLDSALTKYYNLKKLTLEEIEEYERQKKDMLEIAKETTRAIGVYYENLDVVVENYISRWLELGHSRESILKLASYCFRQSIRTLEGLNTIILKLYKLGIVSTEAIDGYLQNLSMQDKKIKEILEKLGITRNVINQDRDFFKTWTQNWNMTDELLDYACSLSAGKLNSMQYLNKLLSNWHTSGVDSLEKAKNFSLPASNSLPKVSPNKGRSYKKEELSALFDSLDEVEI